MPLIVFNTQIFNFPAATGTKCSNFATLQFAGVFVRVSDCWLCGVYAQGVRACQMGLFVFVTCLCAGLKLRLSNAGVLHHKSVLHKKEKLESLYFLKKGCLFSLL